MGRRSVLGMLTLVRSIVSALSRRFRPRAVLEPEVLALHHQLHVLRRQRPGCGGEQVEVVNVVLSLVSGEASYVTGSCIVAGCGLMAHTCGSAKPDPRPKRLCALTFRIMRARQRDATGRACC